MNEQQKPLSRSARRNSQTPKQNATKHTSESTTAKSLRWLKFVLIPTICLLFLMIGAMLGYSIFGEKEVNKGKKAEDYKVRPAVEVFKPSTWKHMFDLVFKVD